MSRPSTPWINRLLAVERRRQERMLLAASASGAVAAAAAVGLLGLSGWFLTGAAVAGAAGAQAFNYLLPAAFIRLLAILRTVFRYFERVCGHEAALAATASLRPQLFAALANGPVKRSLALSGGEASSRLVQDVDALEGGFLRTPGRLAAGVGLATGTTMIAAIDGRAALVLLAVAAISLALSWLAAQRAGPKTVQTLMGELKDFVAAVAPAGSELAAYELETWTTDEIDRRGRALARAQRSVQRRTGMIGAAHALLTGFAVTGVLVATAGRPAPLVALSALAAVMAMESLAAVLRGFAQDADIASAAQRLEPLFEPGLAAPADRSPWPHTLDIEGVFRAAGARIALIGPSGSGKTSAIEILLGLRGPAAAWVDRSAFAYLPQDAALLAGTVRENLLLADSGASDEALWDALRDAALEAHVRALPQGLDSWVGEGGARLSGGQQRRLALARALLRDAPWLVLDEPTAGLDEATEQAVLDGVARRLAKRRQGLLLATHSAAALALCETVVTFPASTPLPVANVA